MLGLTTKRALKRELERLEASLRGEISNAASWMDADSALLDAFGVFPTSAGVAVTPDTARQSSAVSACLAVYGGTIASTPLPIYQRTAKGREEVPGHDFYWLFNEAPCAGVTAASFWDWISASIKLRGDGLAEIVRTNRSRGNEPVAIVPLPRERVTISGNAADRLYYSYDDGKRTRAILAEDILHFPGAGFNGVNGQSVIAWAARNAIGAALAADEFSGGFFKRGANPSIVVEYPQGVAPKGDQQEQLRTQIENRYGGVGNNHRPMVLVNGGKLSKVSLSPQDSQLLETRKFQVIDIARAFGVPPILIGEGEKTSSWGTGVAEILRAFLVFSLDPLLVMIEQEINRKLWPTREKYFCKFDRSGWLEGDNKAQADYFGKALGGPGAQGWMTVNEVRHLKNLPPVPGGDKLAMVGESDAAATV